MKESKRQHRNRVIEETPKRPLDEPEEQKEHWPVGTLPDAPLDQDVNAESLDEREENEDGESPKKTDNGFDEWSVSWP